MSHANIDIRSYGATGDDSTDNTTAIQAAVTAAATSGGAVYVPSGTFRSGQINLASGVTVFGDGYASCVKAKASNNNPLLAVTGTGYTDDVCISRLRIDGNKANNTAGYAIHLGGRRCVVENCHIHDAVAGAIYHGGNATDTPLAGSLRIVNNYILNPGLSGASGGAVAIVHGSHILIADNMIESTDGYMSWGINIEPNGGETIDDIAIHNNVIKGGRVYLDCENLSSPGTSINVTGNTIDARGSGGGASLSDNACPFFLRRLDRLHISGNLCIGHADSIRGSIFVGRTIQQFQIVNNLFFPQAGSGTRYAISFANADNMAVDGIIANNYIYGWQLIAHHQGAPIVQPFSAGDFTASGSMTITMDAGDVTTFDYLLIDRHLLVTVDLDTFTTGGTASSSVRIAIPGGFSVSRSATQNMWVYQNGATTVGLLVCNPGFAYMTIARNYDGDNWALLTNTNHVRGQLFLEVN